MKTYLVGGAVRDILIGRTPREHDIAFEASVAHFLQANPSARKVGKRIDVYLIGNVEHRPVQGGDIRADLLQRDFTINALALEADGTLHAHPDALADLRASIIRPASPGGPHGRPRKSVEGGEVRCTTAGNVPCTGDAGGHARRRGSRVPRGDAM